MNRFKILLVYLLSVIGCFGGISFPLNQTIYTDFWLSGEGGNNGDAVTVAKLNACTFATPGLGTWSVTNRDGGFTFSSNQSAWPWYLYAGGTNYVDAGAHGFEVDTFYTNEFATYTLNNTAQNFSVGIIFNLNLTNVDDSGLDSAIIVANGEFLSFSLVPHTTGAPTLQAHTQLGTGQTISLSSNGTYAAFGLYNYNDGGYIFVYNYANGVIGSLVGTSYEPFQNLNLAVASFQFGRCDIHPVTAVHNKIGYDNIIFDVSNYPQFPLGLARNYTAPVGILGFGPTTYNFGATTINTSNTTTISITNTTAKSLSINVSDSVSSPFYVYGTTSATLAPLQTATFNISYAPTILSGSDSATLTLTGGGGGTVSLSGSCVAACNTLAEKVVPGGSVFNASLGDSSAHTYVGFVTYASNSLQHCSFTFSNITWTGTPVGNVTIRVCVTNAAVPSLPVATFIDTGAVTIPASSFTGTYKVPIIYTPTSGSPYFVIVSTSSIDGSNFIKLQYIETSLYFTYFVSGYVSSTTGANGSWTAIDAQGQPVSFSFSP